MMLPLKGSDPQLEKLLAEEMAIETAVKTGWQDQQLVAAKAVDPVLGPPVPFVECPICFDTSTKLHCEDGYSGHDCKHGCSWNHDYYPHKLTQAVPKSEPGEGWILFPCHQSECKDCYEIASCDLCGRCYDCCSCVKCKGCQSASGKFDHGSLAYCENCEGCENCCNCEGSHAHKANCLTPGWIARGDKLPKGEGERVSSVLIADAMLVDPVQGMADFYLCDYVMAVIGKTFPGGTNLWNDAYRDAHILRRDALTLQSHIVMQCDQVFQDYVFAAIGGELRHHPNVKNVVPLDRDSTWDYWSWMGELGGRETLTQDCLDLFQDNGAWTPSYGGSQWATVAQTLLWRLNGTLDAKTWVDRVFSLQHCSGSLLDKVAWMKQPGRWQDVNYCQTIGNAHAANPVDFYVLCEMASPDAVSMLTRLYGSHRGILPEDDRYAIAHVVERFGAMLDSE